MNGSTNGGIEGSQPMNGAVEVSQNETKELSVGSKMKRRRGSLKKNNQKTSCQPSMLLVYWSPLRWLGPDSRLLALMGIGAWLMEHSFGTDSTLLFRVLGLQVAMMTSWYMLFSLVLKILPTSIDLQGDGQGSSLRVLCTVLANTPQYAELSWSAARAFEALATRGFSWSRGLLPDLEYLGFFFSSWAKNYIRCPYAASRALQSLRMLHAVVLLSASSEAKRSMIYRAGGLQGLPGRRFAKYWYLFNFMPSLAWVVVSILRVPLGIFTRVRGSISHDRNEQDPLPGIQVAVAVYMLLLVGVGVYFLLMNALDYLRDVYVLEVYSVGTGGKRRPVFSSDLPHSFPRMHKKFQELGLYSWFKLTFSRWRVTGLGIVGMMVCALWDFLNLYWLTARGCPSVGYSDVMECSIHHHALLLTKLLMSQFVGVILGQYFYNEMDPEALARAEAAATTARKRARSRTSCCAESCDPVSSDSEEEDERPTRCGQLEQPEDEASAPRSPLAHDHEGISSPRHRVWDNTWADMRYIGFWTSACIFLQSTAQHGPIVAMRRSVIAAAGVQCLFYFVFFILTLAVVTKRVRDTFRDFTLSTYLLCLVLLVFFGLALCFHSGIFLAILLIYSSLAFVYLHHKFVTKYRQRRLNRRRHSHRAVRTVVMGLLLLLLCVVFQHQPQPFFGFKQLEGPQGQRLGHFSIRRVGHANFSLLSPNNATGQTDERAGDGVQWHRRPGHAPMFCHLRVEQLELADFSLFTQASYLSVDTGDLQSFLNLLLPSWQIAHAPGLRPPFFYDLHSDKLNVSVIAIRGTDGFRLLDWFQDMYIWADAALFQFSASIFPGLNFWDSTGRAQVMGLGRFLEVLYESPEDDHQYWKTVANYVRQIKPARRKVIVVGHSLGGGLAQIVGASENVTAISFAGPGIVESRMRLNLTLAAIIHNVVNVVPSGDFISSIGTHGGTVIELPCEEWGGLCHLPTAITCSLLRECGGTFTCSDTYHINPISKAEEWLFRPYIHDEV